MNTLFSDIKVLVWDFDSTLYRPQPELFTAVREAEYRVIMDHTGWLREKAMQEFKKLHKVVTPSGTQVTANLAKIPVVAAARETENYFDRRKYLAKDVKLIALFQKLVNFQHLMVPNGTKEKIAKTLEVLGVPMATFQTFITPEQTLVTKPNSKPFELVLDYTKLPAAQHLMIGDRVEVDLVPAKKLGMRTCWVSWKENREVPNDLVDATVSTIYEITSLLPATAS